MKSIYGLSLARIIIYINIVLIAGTNLWAAKQSFICPVPGCGIAYTKRTSLQRHFQKQHEKLVASYPEVFKPLRTPKKDKAFPCPERDCPYGFSRQYDLARHMRLDHREVFSTYSNVFKPKRSKNNKNWLCPDPKCPSGYKLRCDCANHIAAKHPKLVSIGPVKSIVCPVCQDGCTSASDLLEHFQMSHPEHPSLILIDMF